MENDFVMKTRIWKQGGSIVMTIPPAILDYIGGEEGNELNVMADRGKHGRFFSVWNPKQQVKK